MIRFASIVLFAVAAHASSFETLQAFDAPLVVVGETSIGIHTRLRQRDRLHDFFYARLGPVFPHRLISRVALAGGDYSGKAEDERRWDNSRRTFGGVEMPFLSRFGIVSVRHMVEHHFGGSDPSELRNPSLVQLNRPVRSSTPFGSETFFDQNGFIQHRLQGGVRIPLTRSYRWDVTYRFDARVTRVGPSRPVFPTAFRPRSKERK